jgi:hypothetical protein
MDCRTVFATVDHGYVQVASGKDYQGEINSYNWWFTKFFAHLFGWSTDVQIGDKVRRLDKKSYVQFLNEHGVPNATLKTIQQFSNFNSTSFVRSTNLGNMRLRLNDRKVQSLTRKMVNSLVCNDLDKAAKLLGKGSSVNDLFWIREYDKKIVFNYRFTEDLPCRRILPFTASHMTPLFFAASHNYNAFANLLKEFGADSNTVGQVYTFSRELLDVTNDSHLRTTYNPVFVYRGRGHHRHMEVQHHHGLRVETSQTITYQDSLQKTHDLYVGAQNEAVTYLNPEAAQTRVWNTTDVIGRSRLF